MFHKCINLLCNFTGGEEAVQVGDGKAEHLSAGPLLLAHLQHPGGDLAPHRRPQLGLEAEVAALEAGLGLGHAAPAGLTLEQHPQHPVIAEYVGVAVGPDGGCGLRPLHCHEAGGGGGC